MIQKWMKEELEAIIPNLEWTYDYKTADDHSGVVYNESPGPSDPNDEREIFYPTYSVYIETSDRVNAEIYAWKVDETLNKRRQEIANVDDRSFQIIFIQTTAKPILVGIEKKKMIYSINFQATIMKV